ncbi:MAG: hypothetical protein WD768_23240 [Phycisphaeraceae bacterium]
MPAAPPPLEADQIQKRLAGQWEATNPEIRNTPGASVTLNYHDNGTFSARIAAMPRHVPPGYWQPHQTNDVQTIMILKRGAMSDCNYQTVDRQRRKPTCIAATCFALLTFIAATAPSDLIAAPKEGRIEATPDMLQVDPRLPDAGAYYCGPVALSNGLMWLAGSGFPKLAPTGRDDPQAMMTIKLASNSYLKTFQNKGTSSPRMMLGALKYLNRQGYDGKVTFEGWRTIDRQFHRQLGLTDQEPRLTPDLNRIQDAVGVRDTATVLDVGWYRHAEDSDDYTRVGGHWVTLVGYTPASSDEDRPTLIIHNPDPSAGREPAHDSIRCVELTAGTLRGDFQGLPVRAKGYALLQGLTLPKGVDVAILDGVVVVQVKAPQR